jgi:hypothetical protein
MISLVQVAKICTSLTYEHDDSKLALQDQLAQNEKLLLKVRELQERLETREKDLSFLQTAVRLPFD